MIRLRTLGSLQVLEDGVERPEMRARPIRIALLLYLALEREATRDSVMALLWPEADRERARQALRQTLYALRQDLGGDWFEADRNVLRATGALTADALDVVSALETGSPDRAVESYAGGFLEGFHLANSQPFELWCDQWRARLQRAHRLIRRRRIDEYVASGNPANALAEARRWLDLDPLEDEAQHRVIELLSRVGRGDEALREYEVYSAHLAREGLEPLDETQSLVRKIRSSSSALPPLGAGPARAATVPAVTGDPGAPVLKRRLVLGSFATAVVVLGVGAGLFLTRGRQPTLPVDPERVLVLPLVDETADSTASAIGLLAAEWLTHGVAHLGPLSAVPTLDVLQMLDAGLDGETAARERGAGTLVAGRYFSTGDSLELHVQITDLTEHEIWHVLDPVRIDAARPEPGLRGLRDRLAGSLAVRFIEGSALPRPSVQDPPNLAAFRAVMDAAEFVARRDWVNALPHVQRAARLDTSFYRARLFVAAGFLNTGEPARADSVLDALEFNRERFSPYERLVFQSGRAALRGDWQGRLAASREAARLDPGGTLHYVSAGIALAAGQPGEAITLYSSLDPHCPWAPDVVMFWSDWTGAHHLLGLSRQELREAGRARSLHPDRLEALFLELRALAGMGRADDVIETLGDADGMSPEPGWDQGRLLYRTAAELRAHGEDEAAAEVIAAAVAWYGGSGIEPSFANRLAHADALLLADDLPGADSVLDDLRSEHEGTITILGRDGVIAARLGNDGATSRAAAALEAGRGPYQFGAVDYWLAAIAAWSADLERAVTHLRRAIAEGYRRGIALHADPYLAPLWSLPAFATAVADER